MIGQNGKRMRFRSACKWIVAVGGVAVALSAGPVPAQPAGDPDAAAAVTNTTLDTLTLQLTEAELAVAKANLDYVIASDRRTPGIYSPVLVQQLRIRVDTLQEAAEELKESGTRISRVYDVRAEGDLRLAQAEFDRASELHQRAPDEVSRLNLERKRRNLEAAKLWAELARSPDFIASPTDQVFWRLAQIQKDIMELRIELKK